MRRVLWSGSEKTGFSFYSLSFSLPCTWSAMADAEDTAGMRKKMDIGGTAKDLVENRIVKEATVEVVIKNVAGVRERVFKF